METVPRTTNARKESVTRVVIWSLVLALCAVMLWASPYIHERNMGYAKKTFDYVRQSVGKSTIDQEKKTEMELKPGEE
jgi:hypothetical protein